MMDSPTNNLFFVFVVAVFLVLTPACSDDTETPDKDSGVQEAGADMAGKEAGADMAGKEAGADMAGKEAGADMAGNEAGADMAGNEAGADMAGNEAGADMAQTDGPVGTDGTTPSKAEKVVYSVRSASSASSTHTLYEVMTDGTGQKVYAGILPKIGLESLQVTGLGFRDAYPTDLTPSSTSRFYISNEYYLQLPGSQGRLAKYYESTNKVAGYAQVTPKGKVNLFGMGLSGASAGVSYYVAISKDGKLGAFVQDQKKVFLMKLDGTFWTGTTAVKDVTPGGFTGYEFMDDSLNIIGGTLYFVANDGTSSSATTRSLWQVPTDASKVASKVTLPMVGGAAATTIYYIAASNADQTHTAWLIGSTTSKEDVMVLKEGGTPVNVSKLADNLQSPSTSFQDTLNQKLALSPKGTYVAYGTTSGASANKSSVWVAKADGTGTPVMINSSTNFDGTVDNFGGHYWADEDNLLFMAGDTDVKVDLYHYKVSTKALVNLTKTSTATAAPWKGGKLESDAGWVSPNGKYIYYVIGEPALTTGKYSSLLKVDLTTFAATWISKTLFIDIENTTNAGHDMETAAGSDNVFFVASTPGGTVQLEDLYVFNQSTGSTASLTNLTKHTGTTAVSISGLKVSPDGKYASYITGASGKQTLYVVAAAGGSPVAMNSTVGYIESAYTWRLDSSGVVYGLATASGKYDLYVTSKDGKTSKKLHAAQSYLYVMSSGI